MREIKFRGKDINGKWHYGLLSISQGHKGQPEEGCYISNGSGFPWAYHVMPDTVGQFTGVIDNEETKNEVYEGDILFNTVMGDRWVCKFVDGCFIVDLPDKNYNTCLGAVELFEVIGNIYDNPGLLLKVEK
jgi:hypothetical protein